MGATTKSRRFGQVSPHAIIKMYNMSQRALSANNALSHGGGSNSPTHRKPFGGTKLSDGGNSRSPREEMRSSGGSSHPSVTDESREVEVAGVAERSGSITSHGEPMSVRDLSFDLEQPWQRSLVRELENIEKTQDDKKNARPRAHKILLGRAQSGDYMMEYSDDDDSTITDASSTLPIRPQAIHRKLPVGHAALFQDDEEEIGAPSTDSSLERKTLIDRRLAAFGETRDGVRDSGTDRSEKSRNDEDGQNRMPPDNSRGRLPSDGSGRRLGLARANALIEDRSGYLKSRSLRLKSDEETTATDTADYFEPAACMCIGYNILDYFEKLAIPTPNISTRRKKRRTSLHGPPRRPSTLGTVGEEEATDSPYMGIRDEPVVPGMRT